MNPSEKAVFRCGIPDYYNDRTCETCGLIGPWWLFKKQKICKSCRQKEAYKKYKSVPTNYEKMRYTERMKYWKTRLDIIEKIIESMKSMKTLSATTLLALSSPN